MNQIFLSFGPWTFRLLGKVGPFTIRWYGVMAAVGVFAALLVIRRLRNCARLTENHCYDLVFWALISGVAGARIFHVVQFWEYFRDRPAEIVKVYHGGLVFYGGFITALGVVFVFCRRKKLSFLRVMDVFAPGMALGHAFGRMGCFLNGCCFGRQTQVPWGVVFPNDSEPHRFYCGEVPVHPVQIYEAAINVIIALVLYRSVKRMKAGQTACLYLVIYGTARFLLEFLRGDHTDRLFGTFTPAQCIGLVLVPAGIAAFIMLGRRAEEPAEGR